jgi:hypothetical protein
LSKEQQQVTLNFSKTENAVVTSEAASASQVTSSALIGAAALSGVMLGNPLGVLGLVNMLQFASLVPLTQFSISEELANLLIGNNPFESLPNFSSLFISPDWFAEPYHTAKHYGFETAGFLYNIGQELTVLACLLLALLGLYLGSKVKSCCHSLQLYCFKKYNAFKRSLLSGYLQANFQELLVSALVQLKSPKYLPWVSAFSYFSAWMFLGCGVIGSAMLVYASFRKVSFLRAILRT